MATIREIVAKLNFEVDNSQIKKFETSIASAKSSMLSLSAVVTAAAGALFGIAKLTANHGEEADKLSQRLGVTAERYQELTYAAHLSDISQEELNQTMGILVRTMGHAREGSKEAMKGFALAGGSVAGLVAKGASADEVLIGLADRFQNIKDPAKKAALAQELFGRSGARMIPFLNKGSKDMKELFERAQEYGLVLDKETIDASNEFNDGLKDLGQQAVGLKNIIGSGLVKTLAPLITAMNKWLAVNKKFVAQNLNEIIAGLSDVIKTAFFFIKKLAGAVVALLKPIGGLGTAIKLVVAGFAAFKAMQLLAAMGTMVQVLFEMASAWKFMGMQAMFAQLKALAFPILIGAAVIALGLLIEDIIGFFQGKDSLIGAIDKWFTETFPTAAIAMQKAFFFAFDAINVVVSTFSETLSYAWELMKVIIGGASAVGGAIGSAISFAGSLAPSFVSGDSALPGTGVANQKSLTSSMNAPITITMTGNDPSAPEKVGTSVYENLDEVFRTSSRNLSTGVAY